MADASPVVTTAPAPRARPRRTRSTATVSYRVRPRSGPTAADAAASRVAVRTNAARFGDTGLGMAGFLLADAFNQWAVRRILRADEAARALQLRAHTDAGGRRGKYRSRAATGGYPVPAPNVRAEPRRDTNPLVGRELARAAAPKPVTKPARIESQNVRLAQPQPAKSLGISGRQAVAAGGAPPSAPRPAPPKTPVAGPIFPQIPGFFGTLLPKLPGPQTATQDYLTLFQSPALPLPAAGPGPQGRVEPLPNAEPDAQRCRCRKRKAGKPGKGFFTIDSRGRELRTYWLNREQREK